jgi:hypothetical protein
MIADLVSGIPNFTRNLRMPFHIFAALEKSRADPFRRQVFEQTQTAFARPVVECKRQRSPQPGPTIHASPPHAIERSSKGKIGLRRDWIA